MVKRLPAMQETRVQFLGWEDPLEKEMAIHSSTLAWKIPWTEEPDRLQSMGSQRVRHDWATSLSFPFTRAHVFMITTHPWNPSELSHGLYSLEVKWSEVKSLSRVRLFATPWTVAYQAPQSMEFSRQEYWSGLPFPSPGDLPNPEIEPTSVFWPGEFHGRRSLVGYSPRGRKELDTTEWLHSLTHEKPTANILLPGERLFIFTLRWRTRQRF